MSGVWKYFHKKSDGQLVECNICKNKLKFSSSTSSMWNHMKRKHGCISYETLPVGRKRFAEDENSQPSSSATLDLTDNSSVDDTSGTERVLNLNQPKISNVFFTSKIHNKQQEHITEAITKMIVEDILPISFVEGAGFKNFMSQVIPMYKVPSRKTIKSRISVLYDIQKNNIFKYIGNNFKHVALTTDCWTSRSTESYMTVTLHAVTENWQLISFTLETQVVQEKHTSENLRKILESVMEKWNLANQVIAIVHDNAPNIVSAVKNCDSLESVCCFAHTLQLAINKGLENDDIKHLLTKCSSIVGHFKHSSLATNALITAQKLTGLPEHKLIQAVKTRWNSTFFMLGRLLEQRQSISNVLQDRNVTSRAHAILYELTETNWTLLEKLHNFLKPFEVTTTVMCSEKTPTISMVQPIIMSLLNNFLQYNSSELGEIKNLKTTVASELRTRFRIPTNSDYRTGSSVTPEILDICSFLDPRYKKFEREHGLNVRVKRYVDNLIDHLNAENNESTKTMQESQTALDLLFPEQVGNRQKEKEVDLYFSESAIDKNMCPFEWWKNNQQRFPNVSKVAKRYLSIPATSAPSERIFSAAGNIVNAKRSCLKGNTVNMLTFLYSNLKVVLE